MRRTALLFAFVMALGAALSSCGEGTVAPKVARTVDVSALTLSDVQQRARAAATKPDLIFHSTETAHSDRFGDYVSETWLDLERHVARVEQNGELYQMFGPEKVAQLNPGDRRYGEALYSWDGIDEPLLAFTLNYLTRIIDLRVKYKGVEEAVVDGVAAIKVGVQQETNSDGNLRTEKATIYLDELFFPLKMELDVGAGAQYRTTIAYRNEYVVRDAVAAEFFSFDQVRAISKTASDNLRDAAKPFGVAYWLGDPFEDMRINRVNGGTLDDGEPSLNINYGMENAGAGGPDAPFPCAYLAQYTKRGWADREKLVAQNNPGAAKRIERDTRALLDGEARIFELPGRVIQQPHIEGQVPPMPATLAESSAWVAEITLPDSVVEVTVNCGPPGLNPYRSLDGMRRLLAALRPFDAS